VVCFPVVAGLATLGDRMQSIMNTIAQSTITRALILAIVGLPILFYFGFTPAERSAIGLSAAYYLGFYSPAAGLAAIIGWLAWSLNWFWIAMAIGFALTAALQLWSAGLLDWIPADCRRLRRGAFVHSFCLRYGGALLQEANLSVTSAHQEQSQTDSRRRKQMFFSLREF
jgi:hypothetical protein